MLPSSLGDMAALVSWLVWLNTCSGALLFIVVVVTGALTIFRCVRPPVCGGSRLSRMSRLTCARLVPERRMHERSSS